MGAASMSELVLTPEQSKFLGNAGDLVLVRDAQGKTVGHFTPLRPSGQPFGFSRAEIDEALREEARDPRRIPSSEVLIRLREGGKSA
jgi:hypothetical protein